jgi:hypothetical protein
MLVTYADGMRTTVRIQDEAYELLRKKAEEKGVSLGEAISEAAFIAFRDRPASNRKRSFDLPVSGRGGLRPGVDLDSSSALQDVMDGIS